MSKKGEVLYTALHNYMHFRGGAEQKYTGISGVQSRGSGGINTRNLKSEGPGMRFPAFSLGFIWGKFVVIEIYIHVNPKYFANRTP